MDTYNRLIIIGNGLDIALGLKTRYTDFIFHYVKLRLVDLVRNGIHSISGYDEMLRLQDLTLKRTGHLRRDEVLIGMANQIIENIDTYNNYGEIVQFLNHHKITIGGSNFFNAIVKDINWCDIERTYYEELRRLFKANPKTEQKDHRKRVINALNVEFDDVKLHLEEYLKKENKRLKGLLKENQYFKPLMDSLCSNRRSDQGKVLCLNFNYTKTTENALLNCGYDEVRVINIHGLVDNEENPVIFGYGDDVDEDYNLIENSNENEFLRHFKSNRYTQNGNYEKMLSFIDQPFTFDVCIVGHSCGLSDRTMLKTIFENKNCRDIHVYHHKQGKEAKESHFYKDINISRHFDNKVLKRARLRSFNESLKIPQL